MEHPKKYVHQDLVMAVGLLIIGLAFFIGSFMLPRDTNTVNNIHTFPMLASGALVLFSFYNVYSSWKKTKKLNEDYVAGKLKSAPEISVEKLKYPMIAVLMVLAYAIGVAVIGFFVSTTVFLIASIWYLGYRKLWVILLLTFGLNLFIYVLFVRILYTRLPANLLF